MFSSLKNILCVRERRKREQASVEGVCMGTYVLQQHTYVEVKGQPQVSIIAFQFETVLFATM